MRRVFLRRGTGWSNSSRALARPNDVTGLQFILLLYPSRFDASGGLVDGSKGSVEGDFRHSGVADELFRSTELICPPKTVVRSEGFLDDEQLRTASIRDR